jgi:polysaccharide deacetylase 2 family uncharacterized protein YibQ
LPAPLIAALVFLVSVLSILLGLGLTYDPNRGAKRIAITLPLPPPLATQQGETPASSETPMTTDDKENTNGAVLATPPAPVPPTTASPSATTIPPVVTAAPTPLAPSMQAAAPAANLSPDKPVAAAPALALLSPDALTPAPDPALIERSKDGVLPIIGPDGRKPWTVYARPFDANNPRPRIAIIISGLGQSAATTEAAIQTLPPSVTLAFGPYGQRLDYWASRARGAGHEILALVPMEPVNYPANDPGPQTLLTTLTPPENRDRLNWSLSRFTGYVGILSQAGSRYTTALESIHPTLEEINNRGLMFVDARSSLRSSAFRIAGEIGLPRALNNRFIDIQASKEEIDRRLDELVKIATTSGFAVGIGQPYPATIERVAAFVRGAEAQGLAIAPVSAIADRQKE